MGAVIGRNKIGFIHHTTRIILILGLFFSSPALGADGPSIAWGNEFSGLVLGIGLKGDDNKPLRVVHIYLWAKTTDGREPPMINPFSISLMNFTPEGKSIQKAFTKADPWGKFRWKGVSETTYRSKLLKVSSKPNGKWGIRASIPIVWKGKSTELITGILHYTMK